MAIEYILFFLQITHLELKICGLKENLNFEFNIKKESMSS